MKSQQINWKSCWAFKIEAEAAATAAATKSNRYDYECENFSLSMQKCIIINTTLTQWSFVTLLILHSGQYKVKKLPTFFVKWKYHVTLENRQ